jgi:membrane associated rhomboid family serine protease
MANYQSPLQRTTPAVLNLIIINVLVFLAQNLITQFDVTKWGSIYYYQSPNFHVHQFITSMFMHENFAHIGLNMFGLWMFGTILEKYWGSRRFLIFYFICGIGASLFDQLLTPYDALQMAKNAPEYLSGQYPLEVVTQAYKDMIPSLGASGAIMGLLAAFAYLFPNTELYVMFIPIPVKAKYVIPFLVLTDLVLGLHRFQWDNIGHFAHLGGALIGFSIVYFRNRMDKKNFY